MVAALTLLWILVIAVIGVHRYTASRIGPAAAWAITSLVTGAVLWIAASVPGACATVTCSDSQRASSAVVGLVLPSLVWLLISTALAVARLSRWGMRLTNWSLKTVRR